MKTKQKKPKHNAVVKKKSHAIVKRKELEVLSLPAEVEQSLIEGNLANLSPEKRVTLYMATCKSLRLNPLTKPFCYILVGDWDGDSEKLILYATKNCTDQLRALHGITFIPNTLKQWREEGMLKASISIRTRSGRTDSDMGVIPMKRYSKKKGSFYELSGSMLANAEMHVVTKAKRRATLSICGLGGIVDETELDTMKVIGGTTPDGRIFRYQEEQEVQTPRDKAQSVAQEKVEELKKKAAEPTETKAQEPSAKKEPVVRQVEIGGIAGDEFAVTGFLEDLQMARFLEDCAAKSFEAKADKRVWWRMEDRYRRDFESLCNKLELKITYHADA